MDLNFLTNYLVVLVVGICVCVGYVVKTSFPSIDNKHIPLIMAILGVILNIWLNKWNINPEILLGGLFSGLSSTGLHQIFKNLIQNK
ncbi:MULTISPECIES: phage holin family protein [Terrisporobacter]|uniref:Phage holin family protein n=1 Tax=Terrisporobacter muris TaxID=2963284 RepID=A0A9X2M9F7_9FIRM|nr:MULTISPECIES: phage holin family protein [Terrisporobacter]MCC3668027.1 phage holin family protein [Terrisporobacter mayombei]MCR1821800.1 phage holin family protein [Terrisporobacter muris]